MSNVATHQKVIKNKLGVLKLAKTLGNVSQACKMKVKIEAWDTDGLERLIRYFARPSFPI